MTERNMEGVKCLAKRLRRALPIKHSFALELIARALKFKNFSVLAALVRNNGPWFESRVTGEEFRNRLVAMCQQSVKERLGVEVSEIEVRAVLGSRGEPTMSGAKREAQTAVRSDRKLAPPNDRVVAYIGTRFIARTDGAVAIQHLRRRAIARSSPDRGCVLRPGHSHQGRLVIKTDAEGRVKVLKE